MNAHRALPESGPRRDRPTCPRWIGIGNGPADIRAQPRLPVWHGERYGVLEEDFSRISTPVAVRVCTERI